MQVYQTSEVLHDPERTNCSSDFQETYNNKKILFSYFSTEKHEWHKIIINKLVLKFMPSKATALKIYNELSFIETKCVSVDICYQWVGYMQC